jgi:hypothetical protein
MVRRVVLCGFLLFLGLTTGLAAQTPTEPIGPATSNAGPTRDAERSTAIEAIEESQNATPRLMLRYEAFQADLARDFGVLGPRVSDRIDAALAFKARIEEKWGDHSVYQWLERGLAAYSWFRANTQTERQGFNIGVDTGRVAQGRLGIQMSRPLADQTSE